MAKYTPKQIAFVNEYLKDMNATQAYKRAGYSVKSDQAAGVEGHKLLKNPKIQSLLQERMKDREQRTEITQDKVLAELAKIAFADLKSVMSWDEEGIRLRPMDEVDGTLLSEISETENITDFKTSISRKVKLHDKMKALELVGRHLGMFKDNINLSGALGVTIVDDVEDEDE